MEYPGIDKPDTIDHGPKNGFNCSASLGMIYQAMGVHSGVISGRKQIDYIDRNEMVGKDLKVAPAFQATCCCCTSKHAQAQQYWLPVFPMPSMLLLLIVMPECGVYLCFLSCMHLNWATFAVAHWRPTCPWMAIHVCVSLLQHA